MAHNYVTEGYRSSQKPSPNEVNEKAMKSQGQNEYWITKKKTKL